jgi:hypothetical protein
MKDPLWLGHETVRTPQIYPARRPAAHGARPRPHRPAAGGLQRYRPPDSLLAFLEACDYADSPSACPSPMRRQSAPEPPQVGIIPMSA